MILKINNIIKYNINNPAADAPITTANLKILEPNLIVNTTKIAATKRIITNKTKSLMCKKELILSIVVLPTLKKDLVKFIFIYTFHFI